MSSPPDPDRPALPESHARVLAAAWKLAASHGIDAMTLATVAREAGVSRQAVYLFFGSRAGLLKAMTLYKDDSVGIRERLRDIVRMDPPGEALTPLVSAWFGYCPQIEPVAHALTGAAVTDADARQAWSERMAGLRALFLRLCRRIAEDGQLAQGWSEREAADFIYAQTHFHNWRHLTVECGWTTERAADRIAALLRQALLRP